MTLHQPFVHDLAGVFAAPIQAWATPTGAMTGAGAEGIFLADDRIISTYDISVNGVCAASVGPDAPTPATESLPAGELSPVGTHPSGATKVRFVDVVSLEGLPVDPVVRMIRTREASIAGVQERIVVRSAADHPVYLQVRASFGIDALPMAAVKDPHLAQKLASAIPTPEVADGTARWSWRDGTAAELTAAGSSSGGPRPTLTLVDGAQADGGRPTVIAEFSVTLEPNTSTEFSWSLRASDSAAPFAGVDEPSLVESLPAVADDASAEARRVHQLLEQSLSDLSSLRLSRSDDASQAFLAAGAPWFFTLFGRDSLIAASLLTPVTSNLAARTVRTLAAQQGTKVDVETAEQPGKILHEVRAVGMDMGDAYLPPVYYGTIDATGLWVQLVSDLDKAGDDVTDLAENVARAADWLLNHSDADGDFFLEYIDESGHGLANQGWKDSGDSVRFANGTIAEGPIALSEVQAYAYEACLESVRLLEKWGHADAAELAPALRERAAKIRAAFREQFWVGDAKGRYIALALDGSKKPVDGVASNMGHVLGTGLLDADEERVVMDRLLDPTMFSGYGIRTLSSDNAAYWPNRYHGGTVWTHDTAFILRQALRAGFVDEARVIARGMVHAADGFDDRLPELFAGDSADDVFPPLLYPASCRPQAWAAASAVPVAQALGVLDGEAQRG